jgi:hypothetical protein
VNVAYEEVGPGVKPESRLFQGISVEELPSRAGTDITMIRTLPKQQGKRDQV